MSEEEKKAIEDLFALTHINGYIDLYKQEKVTIYTSELKRWQNAVKKILNLIEKQQKLLEQKDNKIKELEYKYNKALTDLVKAEKENEELRKGQQSLMQSRKKWKDRYYKLKRNFDYIQHEHDRLDKRNNELEEELQLAGPYVSLVDRKVKEYLKSNNYISKDKIREKIEELDKRIDYLKTELNKCYIEREKLGTETEIDNNEEYIFNLEHEENIRYTQKYAYLELLQKEE